MTHKAIPFAFVLAVTGDPVGAQAAFDCDASPIPHLIDSLHEDAFRSFADGAIRIFALTVDANLPSGVLLGILHPTPSDLAGVGPGLACTAIYNAEEDIGYFGQVFLDDATAEYDPESGLSVNVPIRQDFWQRPSRRGTLFVNIRQSDGVIKVELN